MGKIRSHFLVNTTMATKKETKKEPNKELKQKKSQKQNALDGQEIEKNTDCNCKWILYGWLRMTRTSHWSFKGLTKLFDITFFWYFEPRGAQWPRKTHKASKSSD